MIQSMNDLLIEQIRDLYDAETRIAEALPTMIEKAHDAELKAAFRHHLDETKQHVNRMADACDSLGVEPQGETCEATKGLIREAESLMQELSDPVVGDAALIAAAQRIEHYEIASYGSAATFAGHLGEERVKNLLGKTLEEEKAADEKLKKIAQGGFLSSGINERATDQ